MIKWIVFLLFVGAEVAALGNMWASTFCTLGMVASQFIPPPPVEPQKEDV